MMMMMTTMMMMTMMMMITSWLPNQIQACLTYQGVIQRRIAELGACVSSEYAALHQSLRESLGKKQEMLAKQQQVHVHAARTPHRTNPCVCVSTFHASLLPHAPGAGARQTALRLQRGVLCQPRFLARRQRPGQLDPVPHRLPRVRRPHSKFTPRAAVPVQVLNWPLYYN